MSARMLARGLNPSDTVGGRRSFPHGEAEADPPYFAVLGVNPPRRIDATRNVH